MEKRTPHCKLAVVKTLVAAGKIRVTVSALAGGAALGFSFEAIVAVVAALMPRDFYKKTPAGEVYLKLTVIDDVLIVSFKEL